MWISILLIAAVNPTVETVVAALAEKDCPKIFGMLTEHFQKSVPKEKWPSFCNGMGNDIGAVSSITFDGTRDNWASYTISGPKGTLKLRLAFDEQGKISGLGLRSPPPPVAASKVRYRWPLTKPSLVFWGGDTEELNHHVGVSEQQRATDTDVVNADGKMSTGTGKNNEDYFTFGTPVVAAAKGRVIVAIDGTPDNTPGVMNRVVVSGNVVIIEHGPGEFAHYCHLKQGSVRVKLGQDVQAGEVLGLGGNSGNSSQPHLHWHVQDSPLMGQGKGIDPVFSGICLVKDGKQTPVAEYRLRKGDVVVPCAAAR
ncbi:MAG: peptidoglycan DD-metalloendopeptidase family protein [Deltaproteobacteria bacterium]|nr:peptidoglycan DD-metalloendopeptidase family protein [Deltaproteobacteria bacterium]